MDYLPTRPTREAVWTARLARRSRGALAGDVALFAATLLPALRDDRLALRAPGGRTVESLRATAGDMFYWFWTQTTEPGQWPTADLGERVHWSDSFLASMAKDLVKERAAAARRAQRLATRRRAA